MGTFTLDVVETSGDEAMKKVKRFMEVKMPTVTVNAAAILAKLKELFSVEAIKKELADFKTSKIWKWPKEARDVVVVVIAQVEYIVHEVMGMESGGGAEKRKAVIQFLDEVIQLPFWLEWIDDNLIGMAVDFIVATLNTFLGKSWIKSEAGKALVK